MFEKFAGLYTQIQNLKKKLKKLDTSKHNEKQVKEIVEALNILEERYDKEKSKREERLKAKEEAAQEVEKEAINVPSATEVGAVSQNSPAPADANGAPAATPSTTPNQNQSCPLCGGLTFPDAAAYQQHMQYTHASDVMPTGPGQKLDKTVAAVEPPVEAPVEKESEFKLDAEVKPIRGGDSKGKVMRWDGKPNDHVYVMWESGPLKDRDGFGGYYKDDLELVQKESVEAPAITPEPACADCTGVKKIHSDLKSNYEGLLKDLKEERDTHYTQGNQKWVERLDQKIRDLEKSIEEKFGDIDSKACSVCSKKTASGGFVLSRDGKPVKNFDSYNEALMWLHRQVDYSWDVALKQMGWKIDEVGAQKEAGAENAKDLTIMDHTPPRANSGPDAGGKDTHDEFQDEWALPAGIELQSKLPNKQKKELDALVQQAVYGYQINIMDMSKVYQAGEAALISGQDVTAAVKAFLDSMVAAGGAQKTAAVKTPVVQPTKLLVFKREFLATPLKEQEKFGGYEISQNGKKLFKINSKDSQPMSKEQIEFCAQIELTRGLKQAKLVEKVAFLTAGTKVYILAQDKPGKRFKFASMEHGLRGWAPMSKFAFQVKEGEMRKHKDHIDNTYGHNGKEILVDCPNGSGNLVWLPINELLPIQAPPATPESLNPDLGAESAKECPDCHGNFEGAEGETCPTCGRFAVQKEAGYGDIEDPLSHVPQSQWGRTHKKLKPTPKKDLDKVRLELDPSVEENSTEKEALRPALAPQILNRRQEVNATIDKEATVVHREDGWHVLSEKGKNLGGPYKSKAEAVKRLRQVEYFKHHGSLRPFSKKADVLTDHVNEVKNNIEQVQQRLQEVPAVKTADTEKEALNIPTVTDETLEETETGNSITPIPGVSPLPTMPTFNNVQPTDNDNLEIPVPMPTSPPPPGQKWVYNDVDGAYVLMPDSTDPSKLV